MNLAQKNIETSLRPITSALAHMFPSLASLGVSGDDGYARNGRFLRTSQQHKPLPGNLR
jgi:hypothetical protein